MMNYTVVWVGHCLNPDENHDKIWGYLKTATGGIYSFWGGRGKSLSFKRFPQAWQAEEVKDKKEGRRKDPYMWRSVEQMSRLWPEFNEHLESCYAMAKLSGKIRTDE